MTEQMSRSELLSLISKLESEKEHEREGRLAAEQALRKEKARHNKTKRKCADLKKAYELSKTHCFQMEMRLKNLESQLEAFRSGSKFTKLRNDYQAVIKRKDKENAELKKRMAELSRTLTRMRKEWAAVFDMIQGENDDLLKACERRMDNMWKQVQRAERDLEAEHAKGLEARKRAYEAETKRDEVIEKNLKLQKQLDMNHENSSIPSSAEEYSPRKKKKIQNSRKKTDRRPGAQPGRKFAALKRREDENIRKVRLEVPADIAGSPDWYATGKVITKQLIDVQVRVVTIDYEAEVLRNRNTGQRWHAPFPEGMQNAANYGSNLKALILYLTDYCNVADEKVCRFIESVSGGELTPSKGFVNGLCEEFSRKSGQERRAIYSAIQQSKFAHVDGTVYPVNGVNHCITVNGTPEEAYFTFTLRKGHHAVKETPIGQCEYQGYLVHDGESTFEKYARKDRHQQCWAHPERKLKGSILYEPDKTWNQKMLDLLTSTIHMRKKQDGVLSDAQQAEIRRRYDEITALGLEEYAWEPATDGYPDGNQLLNQLIRERDSMLNCLDKPWLPHTNNHAERLIRCAKRHTRAAVTNRSIRTAHAYADFLTVTKTAELRDQDVFSILKEILARPLPRSEKSLATRFRPKMPVAAQAEDPAA